MGKTERCNRKSDALKLYIKMLQLKKKNTQSFLIKSFLISYSSLKGEADIPATRKYQKVLAHVKCGTRRGALAMRTQTHVVGKHLRGLSHLNSNSENCLQNGP